MKKKRNLEKFNEAVRKGLRLYRHSCELSQKELAEKAGLNEASISHIESGFIQSPNTSTLMALLSAMGVKISEFFNKINY